MKKGRNEKCKTPSRFLKTMLMTNPKTYNKIQSYKNYYRKKTGIQNNNHFIQKLQEEFDHVSPQNDVQQPKKIILL